LIAPLKNSAHPKASRYSLLDNRHPVHLAVEKMDWAWFKKSLGKKSAQNETDS
jgi:hypothetical protein